MFVKRSIFHADTNTAEANPASFQLELRNETLATSTESEFDFKTNLMNNSDTRDAVPSLTPSLTMLIIFVIPTILILFCLYFCRKWAQEGQTLNRFVSRTDEMDGVVTTSAPLTPPPAYPDDKPPSYDEALKKEIESNSHQIATMSQSQQRLF